MARLTPVTDKNQVPADDHIGGETWIVPWVIGWRDWREGKNADRHDMEAGR